MRILYLVVLGIIFSGCGNSIYRNFKSEFDYEKYPYERCGQIHVSYIERAKWIDILPSIEGIPYQWGGQSPDKGFDCSGLIVWLYNKVGIYSFRYKDYIVTDVTADSLYRYNTDIVYRIDDLEVGDFIFFDSDFNNIYEHVSIFVGLDYEGGVWIWDATDKLDGQEIKKVSYRGINDFINKNPIFAKPLKTSCD